jgi:hypothetical protein
MRLKAVIFATVVTVMAFLAVVSASASTLNIALCGSDALECKSPLTHLHSVDEESLLLTSITDILCTALFLGDVLTASGLGHLSLSISGKFTATNCETEGGASCEVKELSGPASIKLHKSSDELASVTGEGEALLDCSTTPHCVYNGEGLKGHVSGALSAPSNGLASIQNAVVKKISGFFCPTTSELDVSFAPLTAEYIKS